MTTNFRQVRLFLSSTFKDMNEERDYLNKYVFPEISEYCTKRYLEFVPIDLRWGISEDDSRNGLVLSACLDEIRKSRPFFVGILGSRYGWVPTQAELDKLDPSLSAERKWLELAVQERASITEMEFLYGALHDNDNASACFFMRDESIQVPEDFKEQVDSEAERKLAKLKQKVRSQTKYPCYTYSSIKEFAERLTVELKKMIDMNYPHANDEIESLVGKHNYYLDRDSRTFCDYSSYLETIESWLHMKERWLILYGKYGGGYNELLACAVHDFRQKFSSSQILYFDFRYVVSGEHPIKELKKFIKAHKPFPNDKWGLLALNYADMLTNNEAIELLQLTTTLPPSVQYLVGATYNSPVVVNISYARQMNSLQMTGMSAEQVSAFVHNYLRFYGKSLNDDHIQKIASSPSASNGVMLKVMLDDLVSFGSFEQIGSKVDMIVSDGKYMDQLFRASYYSAHSDFKKIGLGEKFLKAATIISIMETGVSEREIMEVANISQTEWSIFGGALMRLCTGGNTRLTFPYQNWRYEMTLIGTGSYRQETVSELVSYFIEKSDVQRTSRIIADLCFQLFRYPMDADLRENAMSLIHSAVLSPEYVFAMSQGDLHKVWSKIIGSNRPKYMNTQPSAVYGKRLETYSWEERICYYQRLADTASALYNGGDVDWCYGNILSISDEHSPQMTGLYQVQYLLDLGLVSKAQTALEEYSLPKGLAKLFRKPADLPSHILAKAFLLKCKAAYLIDDGKSVADGVHEFEKYLSSIPDGFKYYYDMYVEAYLYYADMVTSDRFMSGAAERVNQELKKLTSYIVKKGLGCRLSYMLLAIDAKTAYSNGDYERIAVISSFMLDSARLVYGDGTLQNANMHIFVMAAQNKVHGVRYDRSFHTPVKLINDGIFTGVRIPWLNHYLADSSSIRMWRCADPKVRWKVVKQYEYFKDIVSWLQPFIIDQNKIDLISELRLDQSGMS